jgi:hypothetical protein
MRPLFQKRLDKDGSRFRAETGLQLMQPTIPNEQKNETNKNDNSTNKKFS